MDEVWEDINDNDFRKTSRGLYFFPSNSVKRSKKLILSAPSPKLCTRGSNSHRNLLRNILCRSSSSAITVSPSWFFCECIKSAPSAQGHSLRNANKCKAYGTVNSGISIILMFFSKFFSAFFDIARHCNDVASQVRRSEVIH